jgi:hypothetical protein
MKHFVSVLLFSILLLACSQPTKLESALKFAGSNRQELEKALNHYATNPADSLKYRAACFLIENMPYHYSYKNKKLEHYRTELYPTAKINNQSVDIALHILAKKYGVFDPLEYETESMHKSSPQII